MTTSITSVEDEKKALVETAIQKTNRLTEEAIVKMNTQVNELKEAINQAIDLDYELAVAQIYSQADSAVKHCSHQNSVNMSDHTYLKSTLTNITSGYLKNLAINAAQLKHKLTEVELAALGASKRHNSF